MQCRSYTVLALFILPFLVTASGLPVRPAPNLHTIVHSYGLLPIGFEENRGQAEKNVLYLSRGPGYSIYLLRGELLLAFDSQKRHGKPEAVRIAFAGTDKNAEAEGRDLLPGTSNYYIGNDAANWRTGVPQFRQIRYRGLYPGVDLIFYGNGRQLEFDFDIAPGADPSRIGLQIHGASVQKSTKGLELVTPSGRTAVLKRPDLYQIIRHGSRRVAGDYVLRTANEVAFRVGSYDKHKPLVIDPALIYSTLLGGSQNKGPLAIAVDGSGAAYVTGLDFGSNAFVVKLDPTGSTLVYSTLLGGTKQGLAPVGTLDDVAGLMIAVDGNGNAYFAGETRQIDFPTTTGVFSGTNFCAVTSGAASCLETFAAKLDSTGKLVYSTFLAKSSVIDNAGPVPSAIAVDANGAVYLTGMTATQNGGTVGPLAVAGLTTTPGAFQTSRKNNSSAFVLKLHPDGSSLDYSTYLGGSTGETFGGIAVDSSGVAYVDGGTTSTDFPVTAGASLTTNPGTAGFFSKLKADGSGLVYSTFVAGPSGQAEAISITIDSGLAAYLTGVTAATFPKPVSGTGVLPAFAAKFDASGTLVYSILLGTQVPFVVPGFPFALAENITFSGVPPGSSIAVDPSGSAYAASGGNSSTETKIDSSGNLVYTVPIGAINGGGLGGVALDNKQNFYVAGIAGQLLDPATPVQIPDIGTTVGALQMLPPGGVSEGVENIGFIQKYAQSLGAAVAVPNPRTISFSPVLQKGVTSSPRTVQLFNYGDAALAINGISIGGTNSSDFAIVNSKNTCGSTLAAQANCSLQVTFTPTVNSGTRTATVNLNFGGGLASQTVALTGQAGSPVFQASPASINFGNTVEGFNSIVNLTIANTGTAPLNLLAIPVFQGANPADFITCVLMTGHCGPFPWPPSIPAGGNVVVPIAFVPSATGSRSAQLVFTTDAAGSPQTVPLTGNGSLLSVNAPFGGSLSQTVTAGQTANYLLQVNISSALSGTITVTCTGAPVDASCVPSPSSFLGGSTTSQNLTVTVSTTARTYAMLTPQQPGMWWSLVGLLALGFLCAQRLPRLRRVLVAASLAVLLTAAVSCGGGYSSGGGGGPRGTPAGTYTLMVTASAPGASVSVPLTLNVQ